MHQVLIIGCGSIGERHLRCFQKTGRAKVIACDANSALLETLARGYGVETVLNWEKALEANAIDAAVVCTPAHLHVPIATALLRRGLHVLIEKPLSQGLAGIDELIRARDAARRQAAVAYVLHCHPLLAAARDFIRTGELGPVLQAVATSGQYFPGGRPPHTVHYSKTYYRDRKTGGGAIQDALTHVANWMESVVGPTESLLCDCAHLAVPEVSVEDTVHIAARHGPTLVNYTLNQFQAPNESALQFNTARGSVRIEVHGNRWGVYRLGESRWEWHEVPATERDAIFITQANRFLDLMDGKPASLCTLEAAVQTLRFNLAALASADAGGVRVHCASLPA